MERSSLYWFDQNNPFDYPLARVKIKSEYPEDSFLSNVNSVAALDQRLQIPADKIVIVPRALKSEPDVSCLESKPIIHIIDNDCPQSFDATNLRKGGQDESLTSQKLLESCSKKKIKIILQRVDENIMRELQRRKKVQAALLFARRQRWIRDGPSSVDKKESVVSVKSEPNNFFDEKDDMIVESKDLIWNPSLKPVRKSCRTKTDEDDWQLHRSTSKNLIKSRNPDNINCVYENTKTVFPKRKNQNYSSQKVTDKRGREFRNTASTRRSSLTVDEKPLSKNRRASSVTLKSQENDNNVACPLCLRKFSYKGNMKRHVIHIHKDVQASALAESDPRFTLKSYFKIPSKTHSNKKCFMCAHCSSKFSHEFQLKIHLKKHSGALTHVDQKLYPCAYCPRSFDHKSHLRNHIANHDERKPLKCDYCSVRYSHRGHLKKHIISMHSNERSKACSVRLLRLANESQSKDRNGDKPLRCAHCPAIYSHSGDLKKHIMKHIAEKPYACSDCPFKFQFASQLKYHLKNHIGYRPFQCAHCPACYSHPAQFQRHIMTHVHQKLYSCTKCTLKFQSESVLSDHLKKHTSGHFACNRCPKSYSLKHNLDVHVRNKHTSQN